MHIPAVVFIVVVVAVVVVVFVVVVVVVVFVVVVVVVVVVVDAVAKLDITFNLINVPIPNTESIPVEAIEKSF